MSRCEDEVGCSKFKGSRVSRVGARPTFEDSLLSAHESSRRQPANHAKEIPPSAHDHSRVLSEPGS